MIQIEAKTEDVVAKLKQLKAAFADGSFERPLTVAALRAQAALVALTPHGWTGLTARSWKIEVPAIGARLIYNDNAGGRIMWWLEHGSGQSTGGYIYPKTATCLFIPLTSTAALGGWTPGMKFGVDYVLAKRVRGIKAMHLVANYLPKAQAVLKEEMQKFLRAVLS